jgi:hypothetical protein
MVYHPPGGSCTHLQEREDCRCLKGGKAHIQVLPLAKGESPSAPTQSTHYAPCEAHLEREERSELVTTEVLGQVVSVALQRPGSDEVGDKGGQALKPQPLLDHARVPEVQVGLCPLQIRAVLLEAPLLEALQGLCMRVHTMKTVMRVWLSRSEQLSVTVILTSHLGPLGVEFNRVIVLEVDPIARLDLLDRDDAVQIQAQIRESPPVDICTTLSHLRRGTGHIGTTGLDSPGRRRRLGPVSNRYPAWLNSLRRPPTLSCDSQGVHTEGRQPLFPGECRSVIGLTWPFFSSTVTENPAFASLDAVHRPPTPAPMTTTRPLSPAHELADNLVGHDTLCVTIARVVTT